MDLKFQLVELRVEFKCELTKLKCWSGIKMLVTEIEEAKVCAEPKLNWLSPTIRYGHSPTHDVRGRSNSTTKLSLFPLIENNSHRHLSTRTHSSSFDWGFALTSTFGQPHHLSPPRSHWLPPRSQRRISAANRIWYGWCTCGHKGFLSPKTTAFILLCRIWTLLTFVLKRFHPSRDLNLFRYFSMQCFDFHLEKCWFRRWACVRICWNRWMGWRMWWRIWRIWTCTTIKSAPSAIWIILSLSSTRILISFSLTVKQAFGFIF